MKNSSIKQIIDISERVMGIAIMQERAITLCVDLMQNFYELPIDELKLHRGEARIKNDIALDYISQMQDKLKEVQELLSEVSE